MLSYLDFAKKNKPDKRFRKMLKSRKRKLKKQEKRDARKP